ncbi:MAG: hypothetical protein LZF62_480039 [Nitrospira sp.]|nr:MAG: hypothetical protein LZF62_480039 [Nitrospira sp.]
MSSEASTGKNALLGRVVEEPDFIVVQPSKTPAIRAHMARERMVRRDIVDLLGNENIGLLRCIDALTVPSNLNLAITRRLYLFGTGPPRHATRQRWLPVHLDLLKMGFGLTISGRE